MTQQVEVLVKMTFEVDAELDPARMENDINAWVEETMTLMDDKEERYIFLDSEIIYLKEEAEIYGNK